MCGDLRLGSNIRLSQSMCMFIRLLLIHWVSGCVIVIAEMFY